MSGQTSERWPACIPAIRAEVQPPEYGENGITPEFGLSAPDVAEVRKFYPPLDEAQYRKLHPFRFAPFDIGPGEQVNYLIEPTQTREYTMQAFGSADTLMVLFEDHGGDLRFMAGDDHRGYSRNARIETRSYPDRRYVLRVRLYLSWASAEAGLMMW